MIEFAIPRRCPSIQGRNVGKQLSEWRALICETLRQQGLVEGGYSSPEEGIRRFVLSHMDGRCHIEMEFHLRATKRVTDLDNMSSFVLTCFRTEMTPEAREIENELEKCGIRPWFYYPTLGFPASLDFVRVAPSKRHGATEDLTWVRVERLHGLPAEQGGVF